MITVAKLGKSFGSVVALDGIDFTVAHGERIAFVGSNGSGKTTLLRALLGLVRFEGKITIAGSDVAREPRTALRSVAYIPQIAPPIEAPVHEVVRAHAALRGIRHDATYVKAARLGLERGTYENKRFRDLSGGMKQKVLAAMALATDASVVVCDEPTANLDGDARAAFFEELADRPKTGIVVLCSHRIEEVRQLVDRVIELHDGKLVRDVSLAELLADLRAFRVDVVVRAGATGLESFLGSRSFHRSGPQTFTALVAQNEKLDVVTRLLRDHAAGIEDVSVAAIDDFSGAARVAKTPSLRLVGGAR